MKKLATLLLAAGMIVAASAPASAVDVKMNGEYVFTFISGQRIDSADNYDRAGQRLRLGMTFTASENLSGYVQMQAGIGAETTDYDWGTTNNAKTNLGIRQAYIDWLIPQTTVTIRMGKQLVGLPEDAFGKNAIMHPGLNSRDGVVLSTPVTDWLDVTALWVRAGYNNEWTDDQGTDVTYDDVVYDYDNDTSRANKSDVFAVSAAMKFDGFSITPYAVYGSIDDGANKPYPNNDGGFAGSGDAYWFGVTSAMNYFDPFVLKLSGAYGGVAYDASRLFDRSGWYVQAKASYRTAYGTPVLGAWYGSGDDSDSKAIHQNWIPSVGGRFHPTFNFAPGEYGLFDPQSTAHHSIAGTWGIQAGIEDVSFLADLTHAFTVTMFRGTNSSKWADAENPIAYMTSSDTVVEFNLSSTYQIYKNLAANLELAYLINEFDKADHSSFARKNDMGDDAWSAALTFAYKF